MDGKICQNIKPLPPALIPCSVQLSTLGILEAWATYGVYTFCVIC